MLFVSVLAVATVITGAAALPELKARNFGQRSLSGRSASPHATVSCNIQVKNAGNGSIIGFVAGSKEDDYYSVQANQASSLLVTFSYSVDSHSHLDLKASNGDAAHPYAGFVKYNGDLQSDNTKYIVMGGVNATSPGSPPSAVGGNSRSDYYTESAIWNYDSATKVITAQWVNSDKSTPPTNIFYSAGFNGIVATANVTSYQAEKPGRVPATLTCLPSGKTELSIGAGVKA